MAAFDRALYCIVANSGSGTNKIITTQVRAAKIRLTGTAGAPTSWSIDAARLYNSAGTLVALAGATSVLSAMFSLPSPTASGADYVTTLSLDKALAAANATVMTHFFGGGHVEFDVTYDTGATATLTVDIRAFKTASFLLNSNIAERAHYPGVAATTTNVGIPSTETLAGNYTFVASNAFDTALNATGSFSATLTPNGTLGDLSFPSAGSSPADVTQTLLLKVTHGVGGASLLPMDVHVPTDFMVLLDQSGSMAAVVTGTTTKWDAAVSAADLFSRLYGDLLQKLTVPSGAAGGSGTTTLAQRNTTELSRFSWDGTAVQPALGTLVASDTIPTVGTFSPGGGTPIGEALARAVTHFPSSKWRRRHILLLTDGMSNAGTPSLGSISSTELPTTTDSATQGVILHVVSYAVTGDTPVVTLSTFAANHGGQFHDAAADNLDPDALKAMFLSILADTLPVNRASAGSPRDVPVEEGIERAIFAATRSSGTTLHLTTGSGPGATVTDDTQFGSSSADGFCWTAVDGPAAGTWSAGGTAPAGASVFALYDLALRMRCGVEPQGLGKPIKVWAELRYHGEPLSGADVRVGTRAPGESLGELLTAFVQQGGIGKALQRGKLGREQFVNVAEGALATTGVDTPSLQRLLLEAAENARNMPFGFVNSGVQLHETSPGRYEAHVTATQNENSYNFYFRADGYSPEGNFFLRDHRLSAVLAPEPNQENSDASLVSVALGGGKVRWTATVFPRTVLNKPVGPGLAGSYLNFTYLDPADRKRLPPLVTRDNLDGSYSTFIELGEHDKVAPFGLSAGPLAPDVPAKSGVVVKGPRHGKIRRVRVTLDRIKIVRDHDGLFMGKGELSFDAVVAPNGNPHRAVRTRLPNKGVLKLESGEARDLKTVIYEGFVEADAKLYITIGGVEFDYFLFFMRKEKLARYHRTVPLKSAHYTPADEANDPEALADWQLWYTVEVE